MASERADNMYCVADAHCDFLYYSAYPRPDEFYDIEDPAIWQMVSLPSMKKGGVKLQCFAIWCNEDVLYPTCRAQCEKMLTAYDRVLACPDMTPFTKSFDTTSKKIASLLTVEGLSCLEGKAENLEYLYSRGVRCASLTWNNKNALAAPAGARFDRGLTAFGKDVIREMVRLNMAIDLAHLSDNSIKDVLRLTSCPVYSSHTNSRKVFPHARSLPDEYIREIGNRGGIVCVNFYSPQLSTKRATIGDVVDHIEHIASVAGIEHVGIGSDFDGMGAAQTPLSLHTSGDFQNLAAALIRRGFTHEQVTMIMYENLASYLKRFV